MNTLFKSEFKCQILKQTHVDLSVHEGLLPEKIEVVAMCTYFWGRLFNKKTAPLALFCEQIESKNYSNRSFLFHDGRVELEGRVQQGTSSFSPLLPDVWGEQALPSVSEEFNLTRATGRHHQERVMHVSFNKHSSTCLKQVHEHKYTTIIILHEHK